MKPVGVLFALLPIGACSRNPCRDPDTEPQSGKNTLSGELAPSWPVQRGWSAIGIALTAGR